MLGIEWIDLGVGVGMFAIGFCWTMLIVWLI